MAIYDKNRFKCRTWVEQADILFKCGQELESNHIALSEIVKTYDEKMSALIKATEELIEVVQGFDERIENVEKLVEPLPEEFEKLSVKVDGYDGRITKTEEGMSEHEKEIENVQENLTALSQNVGVLERNLQSTQEAVITLEQSVGKLEIEKQNKLPDSDEVGYVLTWGEEGILQWTPKGQGVVSEFSNLQGEPRDNGALKTEFENMETSISETQEFAEQEINKKQDKLSAAQINATNSGITADKVSKYDNYDSAKQNALNTTQLNAANSGITSSKVSQYDGYSSGKQDKLVSGTNIKTINGTSLLGSGNISIVDIIYPVGSVIISIKNVNPATYFPNTVWTAYATGRTIIGVSSSHALGSTGGEETHTLSVNEIPSHNHSSSSHTHAVSSSGAHQHALAMYHKSSSGYYGSGGDPMEYSSGSNFTTKADGDYNGAHTHTTDGATVSIGNTGGGSSHNNMPPYITVCMFVRES